MNNRETGTYSSKEASQLNYKNILSAFGGIPVVENKYIPKHIVIYVKDKPIIFNLLDLEKACIRKDRVIKRLKKYILKLEDKEQP